MFQVEVHKPAAWCIVPLSAADMLIDPESTDGWKAWHQSPPRDWRVVGNAVTKAVRLAQEHLIDPFQDRAVVTIADKLPAHERETVRDWLTVVGPEWSPAFGEVSNGRHRPHAVRVAGGAEAPVINASVGDALRHWADHDGDYGVVDPGLLNAWFSEREWWQSPEAKPWRSANQPHLRLWNLILMRWQERLRLERST